MYERSLCGPPSVSRRSSYARMGASPGRLIDWKNSIPSSAGVFGVTGVVGLEAGGELEGDLDLGMRREGLCFCFRCFLGLAIADDDGDMEMMVVRVQRVFMLGSVDSS